MCVSPPTTDSSSGNIRALLSFFVSRTYFEGGGSGPLILQFRLQRPHPSLHGDNKRPILSRTTITIIIMEAQLSGTHASSLCD